MLTNIMRLNLRLLAKPFLSPRFSVGFQRRWASVLMTINKTAAGTSYDPVDMNGVPARCIAPASPDNQVVLYFHGGAYILGDTKSHRGLCSHLAMFANARVYSVAYSLAPEQPYPAARDDALNCYRWLLAAGVNAADITIAGDSAGAGLALTAAMNIRDAGLPMPGQLFLISPFVDMTLSGQSMQSRAKADPMLSETWLRSCGDMYRGDTEASHPDCSPLFGDLSRIPRTLIHVGSEEILLDDSLRLAARLRELGTPVTLKEFQDYWHDFQLQAGRIPMASESLREAASFINAS